MSKRDQRHSIHFGGKAEGVRISDNIIVGSQGLVSTGSGSEVKGFAIERNLSFETVESFIAQLGLPPGADYRELADIVQRASSAPDHSVSSKYVGWIRGLIGDAANVTTVVQAIATLAQSPQAQVIVRALRHMVP